VLELQRMAGNRAVNALVARDPKTKPPPKPAAKPKPKPRPDHNYVLIEGMDPIEFESASFGSSTPHVTGATGQGANREAAAPKVTEVMITSRLGPHSTEIFQAAMWGGGRSAEVVFVKNGQPYLTVKLKNALVSSYSVSGHGGDSHDQPMESWTLNAEKIEYETAGEGSSKPAP
jgi:type VI secretion system secreted protein Hcp